MPVCNWSLFELQKNKAQLGSEIWDAGRLKVAKNNLTTQLILFCVYRETSQKMDSRALP